MTPPPPRYAIKWTETALKMVEALSDARVTRVIVARVDQPAHAPEQQGKPLTGELAGFRSARAVGQRFRIFTVNRQEVAVYIAAVGRRKEGDRKDIYELARSLLKHGVVRGQPDAQDHCDGDPFPAPAGDRIRAGAETRSNTAITGRSRL